MRWPPVAAVLLLAAGLATCTPEGPATRSYDVFLAEVEAGQVRRVDGAGETLTVERRDGVRYAVIVPNVLTDVLVDVANAAARGRVPPPAVTIVPP